MMTLDRELRQLLVETSLMAVNHGFFPQAQAVRDALPWLTDNPQARCIIEATLLIGLGESKTAVALLKDNDSAEADMLRRLTDSSIDTALPVWCHPK